MSEEDLKKIEEFLDMRSICYLAGADIPTWEVKMLAKLYEEYLKLLSNCNDLKEDLTDAINEGINNKINLETDTNNRGRYDAYLYVLDKMQELENKEGASKGE